MKLASIRVIHLYLALLLAGTSKYVAGQPVLPGVHKSTVGAGWAQNSINAVSFRKNAITSHGPWQFTAYYNAAGQVVLARRRGLRKPWQVVVTSLKGQVADAHNNISLAIDGAGYLHLAWNHHNTPLQYTRSLQPYGLSLAAPSPMTGMLENRVTYPQFYRLPNGQLIFMYRHGQSGNGQLVINRYNPATQHWQQLHQNLLDGQGQRNAYWQATVDRHGGLHLSWVWRQTGDVATNQDMGYAYSPDGGVSWQDAAGQSYALPVTMATTRLAAAIPQGSQLINQTGMATNSRGQPYIATYWQAPADSVPQYKVLHYNGSQWQVYNTGFRTGPFSLSGGGTKSIPIARPQMVVLNYQRQALPLLIFRDADFSNKAMLAWPGANPHAPWQVAALDTINLGQWEPGIDDDYWLTKKRALLFIQPVQQADAEGLTTAPPSPVGIWHFKAGRLFRNFLKNKPKSIQP